MTERRCQSCRHFYNKKLPACPECGEPKYAHNTWLAHAKMNGELFKQAEHAVRTQ